jgi:hypothetical protein
MRAIDHLQHAKRPTWPAQHGLMPLTYLLSTTPGVDAETALELARYWGYACPVSIHPDTPNGWGATMLQIAEVAKAEGLPVFHQIFKPMTRSGRAPWAEFHDTLPEATWCHLADGSRALKNGLPILSPLAPIAAVDAIASWAAVIVKENHALAPISLLLETGEWCASYNNASPAYQRDPEIVADAQACGYGWDEYLSTRFHNIVQLVIDACKDASDGAPCVHYYTGNMRRASSSTTQWADCFNFDYYHPGDLFTAELYHGEGIVSDFPQGWFVQGTYGKPDLLTMATDIVAQAINRTPSLGQSVTGYPFVSCGSSTKYPEKVADLNRYLGFLKLGYLTGWRGVCAGYYNPNTIYTGDVGETAPTWLRQIMAVAHVHAEMAKREHFILEGELVRGAEKHALLRDQPAYELLTDNPDVRAVARVMSGSSYPELLLGVWKAIGNDVTTGVYIPCSGRFMVRARSCGTLYRLRVELGQALDGAVNAKDLGV